MVVKSTIEIQKATLKDLSPLRRLEKLCFPLDAWPLLDMIGALTMPHIVRYKAIEDDELIGFVAGELRSATQTGWIATICVHPEYRRQGIAKELLKVCEEEMDMPRCRLTVRESNKAAIELYLDQGYMEVGRWQKYYKGGEDGIVMEKFEP